MVIASQVVALQIAPTQGPLELDVVLELAVVPEDAVLAEPEAFADDIIAVVADVELPPPDGAALDVVELDVTDVDAGEVVSLLLEPAESDGGAVFDVPHADCPRAASPMRRPCPQRRE